MADQYSGWKCNSRSEIIENGNDYVKIRVHVYWKNEGWKYHVSGVYAYAYCNGSEVCVMNNAYPNYQSSNQAEYECGYADFTVSKDAGGKNVSCEGRINNTSSYGRGDKWSGAYNQWVDGRAAYTVSYNANGGSGAPGNQTKYWGLNMNLSGTKPTRTGYSFQGWATSSTGGVAYAAGAAYTDNANLTLYAVWKANTYTVSYNANGGSGAPGNQTKTYGVNLTLSSTKPTKTNYTFKGWSTTQNGSVAYAAGGTYSNNSAITLYAVWELAYKDPTLTNFKVIRCNSDGAANESGTYIKVTFSWTVDRANSGQVVKVRYRASTTTTWTEKAVTVDATKTSGSVSVVYSGFSTETSYIVSAYVQNKDLANTVHTVYATEASIGTIKFPIDVKKGGMGVAFGKAAERDNAVDIGFNQLWLGGIKIIWYE